MKFSKFAFFAAGALLATSCATEVNEPVGPEVANLEDGYVQVELNLPTEYGTRADEKNYSYVTGDANEWAVLNGRVIVWKVAESKAEADASFVCMSELGGLSVNEDKNSSEIDAKTTATAHLQNIKMNDKDAQYCATVVLNYNGDFQWPTVDDTFKSWSQRPQTNSMTLVSGNNTYFTMSQAPKLVGTTPVALVAIDKSKIAQTEGGVTESAASFNVQRGVAKVVVNVGDNGKYSVSGTNFGGDNVSLNYWALDVTNTRTFPVQVTEGFTCADFKIWENSRFSSNENDTFRRIFWAVDPNYSDSSVESQFGRIESVDKTSALYCLENTFDIMHQLQGQTTRVVIKGMYTPKGFNVGETFFRIGNSNSLWSYTTISEEIKGRTAAILNIESNRVAVDVSKFGTANYHSLDEIVIKVNGTTDLNKDQLEAVAKSMGLSSASDKSIATYMNGACYYVARIKHFGDKLTPWTVGNDTYGANNAENNGRWLGRYGVLRNTIYEVKVNSVSNPGSPIIPEINPNDPDDVNDYYIQATINILSWSKRVNDVNL